MPTNIYRLTLAAGLLLGSALTHAVPFTLTAQAEQHTYRGWLSGERTLAEYDFASKQQLQSIESVDRIRVDYRIWDGDSDRGEFDHDDLELKIDGKKILRLNGFSGSRTVTREFEATGNFNALTGHLKKDGSLTATLRDRDRRDSNYLAISSHLSSLTLGGERLNEAPVAVLKDSLSLVLGDGLTLDGSASYTTATDALWGEQIETYLWDVGGMQFSTSQALLALDSGLVAGLASGSHQLGLTVFDAYGAATTAWTDLNVNGGFSSLSAANDTQGVPAPAPLALLAMGLAGMLRTRLSGRAR